MKLALIFASVLLACALPPCWMSAAEKEEPPAATPPESRPRPRSTSSPEDRERYMNLSESAKEKFRTRMIELREKMGNATPEERAVLVKKVFDKIEAEDQGAKPKIADNAPAQEKPAATVRRAELPVAPPLRSQPRITEESKLLPQNYRITITGKEADKPLGNLTGLSCTSAIMLEGTLDNADPPTLINVSGKFDDQEGSITFTYSIGFNVPVKSSSFTSGSKEGNRGNTTTTISYKTQTCQGALRMKAGRSYEVLKAGGITYSVSITPEPDK